MGFPFEAGLSFLDPFLEYSCVLLSANPERIGITQPRVAPQELPWVGFSRFPTLKELNQIRPIERLSLVQPFQGWSEMESTQGRRCYANPGLSDHNPVGVAEVHPHSVWRANETKLLANTFLVIKQTSQTVIFFRQFHVRFRPTVCNRYLLYGAGWRK